MATMSAYLAFDYRNLNLNRLIANQTDFEFLDNIYGDYNGITYEDVAYFEHYSGGYVGSYFGGTGFRFNSDYSSVTAGTVTGYYEEYWSGSTWVPAWVVQNFAYSAVAMAEAAYTPSTADDYAVFAAILNGSDSINLSPYADFMRGYGGNDLINGNAGNDLLYGDAGADTLNGGAGSDTLLGGSGNDSYVVDSAGDRVYETTVVAGTTDAGGTDTVRSSVSFTLGSFVENLVLTGSAAISGNGNSLANNLTGNSTANTLNGGTGADTMLGGAGNDTYVVDNLGDKVYETTTIGGTTNAGGTDTVRSSVSYTLGSFVEKLTLTGSGTINGTGNTLANTLTGNAAANALNGGTGADTMLGGAGNDTYVVDNVGDRVYETTTIGGTTNAGGTDTVRSSVSYTLGSFVEKLVLIGTGTIHGTGNSLANTITGNGAANVLSGGSGNDTLLGGAGNDSLAGGTGNDSLTGGTGLDVFRFDTALSATTNVDRIADFGVADDTIQLENAVFTSLATTGTLAAGRLKIGTAAADGNDFLIYNPATGALSYDADGSGVAFAAVQFATLGTGLALTVSDFFVI